MRQFSTRLFWWRRYGFAKLHGVVVSLSLEPEVYAGVPFDGLDYVPEDGRARWAPAGADWQDMPAWLVRECDRFLRRTVPRDGGRIGDDV